MKVIVIGAGPAGCASAIQLKRFGFDVELVERNRIGGLLLNANLIENYLGFPNGITGEKFCKLMKKHISNLGINVFYGEVIKIDFNDNKFFITLANKTVTSDICIVATGTKALTLPDNIISEEAAELIYYEISKIKRQISNCNVAVLGNGDAAFDYAVSLSNRNSVKILMRGEKPKAIQTLIETCNIINNISLEKNIQLINIIRLNTKLLLNCIRNNELLNFEVDYLIVAIGRERNLPEINEKPLKSDRLFLIGDVASERNIRQASIAAGKGIEVAMKVYFANRDTI